MTKLKQYKMFIDGEWVDSDTKKTFETLNPENNKPWAVVPEASANDVDRAVKQHRKHLKENGQSYFHEKEENI